MSQGIFNPTDETGAILQDPTHRPQGGGTIEQLLSMLGGQKQSNPVADMGSVLGAFSQGEKANRVVGGNMQNDFDRLMLEREADRNTLGANMERDRNAAMVDAQDSRNRAQTHDLQTLQHAAYLKGGGAKPSPMQISLGGQMREVPNFAGLAPIAATAEEMQGGADLESQVLARMKGGYAEPNTSFKPDQSFNPTAPKTSPGMAEQIGSYGGAGAGIIGALMEAFGGGKGGGGALDKAMGMIDTAKTVGSLAGKAGSFIGNFFNGGATMGNTGLPSVGAQSAKSLLGAAPGGAAGGVMSNMLGKAVPLAGAVTGGLGLMKDRGTKANIMNGVQTGASIGTMVAPGIGTAVGAGLGALGGWARGIGGPSETELQGREGAKMGREAITSGATPEQLQQAQGAGWKNPQDALTLIVIRDKVLANGGSNEQANELMNMLYKAEKGGPKAVEQALATIITATQPRTA